MKNDETIKTLSEQLKNFSKKDIIDTINKINDKIGSMYEISTNDFSKFSVLLKDYYSKVKRVEESTKEIEIFVEGDAQNTEYRLKTLYADRKSCFGNLLGISHSIGETFVLIQTLIGRVSVPFNNLRQNVLTVQYLLASLRLSLSCNPLQTDKVIYRLIEELDESIVGYRRQIDSVANILEQLSERILAMRRQDNMHFLSSNMPVESYIGSASRELKGFTTTEYFNEDMFRNLKRHIQLCFEDLNEVVTNLQYHDIIRQKIEHIKEAQDAVLQRIDNIDDGEKNRDKVEAQLKFMARMPEVINVQVAQMMYINKDYQDSIDKITAMLLDVGKEMKNITSGFDKMVEGAHKVLDNIIPELQGRQTHYIGLVETSKSNIEAALGELASLSVQYDETKNQFASIFKDEKTLCTQVEQIENELKKRQGVQNSDLIQRMSSVRADMKCNSNLIITCFNTVTEQVKKIGEYKTQLEAVGKTIIESELMETIKRGIIRYSSEAELNRKQSFELSNFIVDAVKNVEYYNYFKKTVDEIIDMLNDLNNRNSMTNLGIDQSYEDSELLKYIESLYTMKSERDIYGEVLNKSNDNESDEDVEFF